jgi:hypothetical protein
VASRFALASSAGVVVAGAQSRATSAQALLLRGHDQGGEVEQRVCDEAEASMCSVELRMVAGYQRRPSWAVGMRSVLSAFAIAVSCIGPRSSCATTPLTAGGQC